jgi:peptidoglycan/LPS O-acetylase OafA/YrhL
MRLFAASQVAFLHARDFMLPNAPDNMFLEILRLFPGVPIFFFVSGYLISKSYESTPAVWEYAKNRVLRLYPALIVCVAVNILLVWSTGYLKTQSVTFQDVLMLFFAKASFIQFYNPDFMRGFGDGVLNGSLWTICVELQFYVLTPLIYLSFAGKDRQVGNRALLVLLVVFLGANRLLDFLHHDYGAQVWWKLFRVSFIPWIYMFLTGMLFQRNFARLSNSVSKAPAILVVGGYIGVAYALVQYFGFETGNYISPLLFFLIIFVIFRLAYLAPRRVNNILKGNDVSYGIYIWHMPFINQMLYFGKGTTVTDAAIVVALSISIAVLSWCLIEKPALKLKTFTLNTRLKAAS